MILNSAICSCPGPTDRWRRSAGDQPQSHQEGVGSWRMQCLVVEGEPAAWLKQQFICKQHDDSAKKDWNLSIRNADFARYVKISRMTDLKSSVRFVIIICPDAWEWLFSTIT